MHYAWVIVASCCIIGICGYGTYFSFTLFYPHLVEEFGWSRAAISGALSLGLIGYGVCAVPMGWCVDRYGPRVTITIGGALFGLGTSLGAFIDQLWHLYVLYGGLTAIGMGAAWAPLVSTVSRWFDHKRGLAIGIASIGGGTGTFFIAPLADHLLATVGWREAYLWLGLISGSTMIGCALVLDRDPGARGMEPYRASNATVDARRRGVTPGPEFDGIESIMRTPVFWRLIAAFGCWWFAGAMVFVQLGPFMAEKEFGLRFAALAVMAFGAGNGFGKIGMGIAADRIGGRHAFQVATIIAGLAMLGMTAADSQGALLVTTALFGFGFGGGTPQLTTVGVTLFGLRSVGILMGAVLALIGIVGAGGPFVSGLVFDLQGSYGPAFVLGAIVFLAGVLISTTLHPPLRENAN
jgi:MFS transporter, OFA family, oxalate/formate antiporter